MSYYSRYIGSIDIYPPIPASEIIDTSFIASGSDRDFRVLAKDVMLIPSSSDIDFPGSSYAAIAPIMEGEYKGYHMTEDIQKIVDTYGEGRSFTGFIQADGEEAGDIRRYSVIDGKVVTESAIVIWRQDLIDLLVKAMRQGREEGIHIGVGEAEKEIADQLRAKGFKVSWGS